MWKSARVMEKKWWWLERKVKLRKKKIQKSCPESSKAADCTWFRIYHFRRRLRVHLKKNLRGIYVHRIPLQEPDIYSFGCRIYECRVNLYSKSITPLPSTRAPLLPISISRSWLRTTITSIPSPSYKIQLEFHRNRISLLYFHPFPDFSSTESARRHRKVRWEAPNSVDSWACSPSRFVFLRRIRALSGSGSPLVGAIVLNFAYPSLICSFVFRFDVFFLEVFWWRGDDPFCGSFGLKSEMISAFNVLKYILLRMCMLDRFASF